MILLASAKGTEILTKGFCVDGRRMSVFYQERVHLGSCNQQSLHEVPSTDCALPLVLLFTAIYRSTAALIGSQDHLC